MRGVAIVCAVVLGACDPGFTLRGTIIAADGRPVANATVHIKCGGGPIAEARSDANGSFLGWDIGWFPSNCVIEAFAPGESRSTTWPMMPACTKKRRHVFSPL